VDTAKVLRAFEDTLRTTMETYVPAYRVVLGCMVKDADGQDICLAQYEVQPDGTFVRLDEEAPKHA
jgi:hypothetical protein